MPPRGDTLEAPAGACTSARTTEGAVSAWSLPRRSPATPWGRASRRPLAASAQGPRGNARTVQALARAGWVKSFPKTSNYRTEIAESKYNIYVQGLYVYISFSLWIAS